MISKELSDLEVLARASIIVEGSDDWYVHDVFTETNAVDNDVDAHFIAAAHPKLILDLIEQARQAPNVQRKPKPKK